jgi:cation/acetate symporter
VTWSVVLVGIVVAATFAIGLYGVRLARTTSDFFVATRAVGPIWNASAIAGEYLSAASFLGIAGLLFKEGAAVLWYPLGYAAGYLVLLLFVAAPLRRFGAYTIPDFAAGRFSSQALRIQSALVVLVIGWFYLLPQMKGAGVTFRLLTGAPYAAGVVLVGVLVTLAVAMGGMKGVTYVQAFHYWTKLLAIGVPAGVLLAVFGLANGSQTPFADGLPTFPDRTEVAFPSETHLEVAEAIEVTVDGVSETWVEGPVTVPARAIVVFEEGSAVPAPADVTVDGISWTLPFPDSSVWSLVAAISLLTATMFGTMGLPHILVRFYTNRDGRSARRTAVGTLALVGVFYMFPWVYAAIGRVWDPGLYVTGDTEVVVLAVPRLIGGGAGSFLGGLVAAGAFSAFLSTSSGLLVSVAGALSHDLVGSFIPTSPDKTRLNLFRVAAVLAGGVAVGLGMLVRPFEINVLVGWAFAIAASAFCPLLILGIWWPRLTKSGAAWGMALGAILSTTAILITMIAPQTGWVGALLAQPAIVTVPLAFSTMILVSLRTRPPRNVESLLLKMHSPDTAVTPPFPTRPLTTPVDG